MRKLCGVLLILSLAPRPTHAQSGPATARDEIGAFNDSLAAATRRMDNAATLALWADDGVSLLPSTKPIEGRKAIGIFMDAVTGSFPGAHMEKFEMKCFNLQISSDWASEWCTEHQIVQLGGGKPPFDGWGKMLLVLRRGTDGAWRLTTEMWNQALPQSATNP